MCDMIEKLLKLKDSLEKNNFSVEIFETKEEAKVKILTEIDINESVGMGGSSTLNEMGLYEDLVAKGNKVYWHWRKDVANPLELARNADIYLSSTNAITMDGKLVNKDGNGNRVASMIFGHKRVYVLLGKNKICQNYKEAIERIENIAAPLNTKRLKLKTPCVYTGKCSDCDSPDRICMAEVILHKKPSACQMYIYIINEDLGF